ncbi:MAG TPA: BlaI/MecI/CopY family transcriptional regulator [Pirellulales bacterium]|nr:BlaI/MecI/CopY family transcriptional regulator [Pirellulales bacterium]
MTKHVHGLGSLQGEVMEFVWSRGEATVAEAHQAISHRRAITYTTVLSAVQKLQRKGWLRHRVAGRAHVYYPTRNREEVGGRTLKELLRTAFSGDPRLLLASLLDDTRLTDEELKELRKLIEQRRKEMAKGGAA